MGEQSDVQTVYKGAHLTMVKRGRWEFVTRTTKRPSVGIVAITDEGNVVVVEQFRPPVGQRVVELPSGLVGDVAGSEDEAFLDAAQRELLEETGFTATDWTQLASGYSSPGLTDESTVLFLARGLARVGAGGGDESENIRVHEVPVGKIFDWLDDNDLGTDLKLLAGLYAAQKHLKGLGDRHG